jgi:hypothetical protein
MSIEFLDSTREADVAGRGQTGRFLNKTTMMESAEGLTGFIAVSGCSSVLSTAELLPVNERFLLVRSTLPRRRFHHRLELNLPQLASMSSN